MLPLLNACNKRWAPASTLATPPRIYIPRCAAYMEINSSEGSSALERRSIIVSKASWLISPLSALFEWVSTTLPATWVPAARRRLAARRLRLLFPVLNLRLALSDLSLAAPTVTNDASCCNPPSATSMDETKYRASSISSAVLLPPSTEPPPLICHTSHRQTASKCQMEATMYSLFINARKRDTRRVI